MRRALPLALLVVASAFDLGCKVPAVAEPHALTLDEAERRLGQPGVHFYDANPREMYDRGHVPGATWVEYDQVHRDTLPKVRTETLIFYCANEA